MSDLSPASGAPQLDAVLQRLRAWRQATGLSYSALALKAGLSRSALVGMDRENWTPSGATIRAVERLMPDGWREGEPIETEQVAEGASATASAEVAS